MRFLLIPLTKTLTLLLIPVFSISQSSGLVQHFQGKGKDLLSDILYYDSQNLFIAGSYGADLNINSNTKLKESDDPSNQDSRIIMDGFIGLWSPQNSQMKWVKTMKHCSSKGGYTTEFLLKKANGELFFNTTAVGCDSFVYAGQKNFYKANDQKFMEVIGKINKDGKLLNALNIQGVILKTLKGVNDSLIAGIFKNKDTIVRANNKTWWQSEKGALTFALMKENFELVKHHTLYGNSNSDFNAAYLQKGKPRFLTYFSGDTLTTSGSLSLKEGYSVFEYNKNLTLTRNKTMNSPHLNIRKFLKLKDGFLIVKPTFDSIQLKDTTLKQVKGARWSSYFLLKLGPDLNLKDHKVLYSEKGSSNVYVLSNKWQNHFTLAGYYKEHANIFGRKEVTTNSGIQGYYMTRFENKTTGLKVGEIVHQKGLDNNGQYKIWELHVTNQGETYLGGEIEGSVKLGDDTLKSDPSRLEDIFVYKFSDNYFTSGVNDAKEKHEVKVYPNPTRGQIQIQTRNEVADEGVNVFIYDILGNVVKRVRLNKANKKISVQELSSGVYYLKGEAGGKAFVEKFVKQ